MSNQVIMAPQKDVSRACQVLSTHMHRSCRFTGCACECHVILHPKNWEKGAWGRNYKRIG